MNDFSIDINCDMAEGMGNEEDLMPWITSANIACGVHAGDETLMKSTVHLCMKYNVSIGAHPSFPDRENFGRTHMHLPMEEIKGMVSEQILLLKSITDQLGAKLRHVKPHGALYTMAAKDEVLARTLASAVKEIDSALIFYGLSQSRMIAEAVKLKLKTANEVFADRTYQDDGSITSRSLPNALIENEQEAVRQTTRFAKENKVRTVTGKDISLKADTLCLHGDGKHAVKFAKLIHEQLRLGKVVIKSI